ncbi:MAG: acetyltransferase [Bacillota bacterium]
MGGLLIIGAGGHGKVVADTAIETGNWDKIAFLDDYFASQSIINIPVVGRLNEAQGFIDSYPDLIVAIGKNNIRVNMLKHFEGLGFNITSIIHPSAFISKQAEIARGGVVFANCSINSQAKLGYGCIINTNTSVDHECKLGIGVHLSPGVNLGGSVEIGDYAWLGVGANVINNIRIGSNVIIGSGATVISDIESNVTAVGTPAKAIKHNPIMEENKDAK